jgi:2-dehydropantoate 2-reductase
MQDIVVIGPGAIGGAVAGALIESGHSLRIAARTPFDLLEVTFPGGRVSAAVECVREPKDLSTAKAVLLAVKAHQTQGAAAWLDATVGRDTTVFILQNGVEHVERLRLFVPESARLVPVVVAMPASQLAPGKIVVASPGSLGVPAGPGAEMLGELIESSFVRVRIAEDWPTAVWTKLLLNAAAGAIGTLTRRDNRMFATDAEARDLVLALMQEVAEVARAEGAKIEGEQVEKLLEVLVRRAGSHKSSIVVDRIEGRATEWDARNAVVERFARRHGIEVPLNRLMTTLIRLGEPEG